MTRFEHNIIDVIPENWERCDCTDKTPIDKYTGHRKFTWRLGTSNAAPHGTFTIHRPNPSYVPPPKSVRDVITELQALLDSYGDHHDEISVPGDDLRQLLEHVSWLQTELTSEQEYVQELKDDLNEC